MYCPVGNATDPIWRVLASSLGISSRTTLKPPHSNPNPNPLANQIWCIDFLTPAIPLIIPHRLPAFLDSLMPLKNWCPIHARWSKSSLKHSIHFFGIFSYEERYAIKLCFKKQNFIAYRSSKVLSHPVCIFEIHQLWQSGFSRVYSNCCSSCSFERGIIKIGLSSHKMYNNNIVNLQESAIILNACTKKSGNLLNTPRSFKLLWYLIVYNCMVSSISIKYESFLNTAIWPIDRTIDINLSLNIIQKAIDMPLSQAQNTQ